ncbi:MAG: sigma-54-dependent transcriptional regulator [Ignavibacteria bacterium]
MKNRILVVDDEKIVRESLTHWFQESGYETDAAESAEMALTMLKEKKYDLVLLDMKMPGMSGLDLLPKIKEKDPTIYVILITAYASVPTAIQALKEGAFDYITKPVDPDELDHLVRKAIEERSLKKENEMLKNNIKELILPNELVGESLQIKRVLEMVNSIANTNTNVMIRGESGVGKELIAKAIHLNSRRSFFPFVTISCSSYDDMELATEIFGHEKGNLEGVHFKKKGKLELANGGTVYFDEIGCLSKAMQEDVMKAIESKQFFRVGGTEIVNSDFRVITATQSPLEDLVREGKFREDLYYRINTFTIFVPPLRERREDIMVLADYFLKKYSAIVGKRFAGFSSDVINFMMTYEWKANIRELENCIERAVVVGKKDLITMKDLPFGTDEYLLAMNDRTLKTMEKKYIEKILSENRWNISRSAEILGIDRVTLYNKIRKYKLGKKHQ